MMMIRFHAAACLKNVTACFSENETKIQKDIIGSGVSILVTVDMCDYHFNLLKGRG